MVDEDQWRSSQMGMSGKNPVGGNHNETGIECLMEKMKRGEKAVIAMVHCLPLPGTLNFAGSVETLFERAVTDGLTLQKAGVDAVIVENTNDQPQSRLLATEQVAALAAVTRAVTERLKIPVGVDAAFNDGAAGLAIAYCSGASFIRSPVFVDRVQVTGVGEIGPCAREVIRMRKLLGAEKIRIFSDVQVKHSHPVNGMVSLRESCRAAVDAGADALIVTGVSTGRETPLQAIRTAKSQVSVPVIIGSGFNLENAGEQFACADGAIVGTALKRGGVITNPVDRELCEALMEEIRRRPWREVFQKGEG